MGQSLGCLAVLVAVLAAGMTWEPAATAARVRTKRPVKKIKIRRDLVDNSNTSYAALGLRAVPEPGFRSSCGSVRGRLQAVWQAMLTLKDRARKSILGRVTT